MYEVRCSETDKVWKFETVEEAEGMISYHVEVLNCNYSGAYYIESITNGTRYILYSRIYPRPVVFTLTEI